MYVVFYETLRPTEPGFWMAGGLRMLAINEHEVMVIRRLLQTMKPNPMAPSLGPVAFKNPKP